LKEISLHILDVAENAISAGAKTIEIGILVNSKTDLLQINIKDDGKGMDAETVKRIQDPFYTTRTTRKIGLGIPLFKAAAEASGGSLTIKSTIGEGTEVTAIFQNSHIDRMPIGDLPGTLLSLLIGSPEITWKMIYAKDEHKFELDTNAVKNELQDIPLSDPLVIKWLREYLQDGIANINNG
jgi:anti-sigma regulatory factor (Ser/Thr protein kinase)